MKKLYLPDLKLAVASGVLAKGCVVSWLIGGDLDVFDLRSPDSPAFRFQVVGDNIRSPGAPDYKKYLLEGEGSKLFSTEARSSCPVSAKIIRTRADRR